MTAPAPAPCTLDHLLGDSPDPALYVPSADMEGALACVEDALRNGERSVLVAGPGGFGKTLLLRILAARGAGPDRFLYVPFLTVEAAEMAPWLLGLLGERARSERTLVARLRARQKGGGRTILLVDEAHAMPPETAERLSDLAGLAGEALQVVLAGVEGPELDAVLERFLERPLRVSLRAPLTEDDVERTIDRMLEIASVEHETKAIAWLGGLDSGDLLRASGGVPRELRSEMLRRWLGLPEPAAVEPAASAEPSEGGAWEDPDEPAPQATPAFPTVAEPVPALAVPTFRGAPLPRFPRLPLVPLGLLLALGLGVLGTEELPREPAAAGLEAAATEVAAAADPGPILVNVNAFPWARIRVDGRDLGATPIGNVALAAGPHRFEARMADGRELTRVVTIGSEERLVSFR